MHRVSGTCKQLEKFLSMVRENLFEMLLFKSLFFI